MVAGCLSEGSNQVVNEPVQFEEVLREEEAQPLQPSTHLMGMRREGASTSTAPSL